MSSDKVSPSTATPPDGQLSFSGIPEAQFVEDVDAFMKGHETAEETLKVGGAALRETRVG